MTFDLKRVLESKIALRRKLAGLPVAEKLAMLDELRDRALSICKAGESLRHAGVRETQAEYRAGEKKEKA